jgi:hypothetical protein
MAILVVLQLAQVALVPVLMISFYIEVAAVYINV